MRVRSLVVFVVLVLLVSACASDESDSGQTAGDAESPDTTVASAVEAEEEAVETEEPAPSDDAASSASSGDATAVVTLENGETYTFGILCGLEPQVAAGVPILFTVGSYDDPTSLDVTQFGAAGEDLDQVIADMLAGAASISLYDSTTFDVLWEADTLYGNEVVLEIDGNTVTGHAAFVQGGELGNPTVEGELVANC